MIQNQAYILKVDQHTMEDSLYKYLDIKIHNKIKNNNLNNSEIIIQGNYNRDNSIISNEEKKDKLFNWKRPTLEIKNNKYFLNCFPGEDYIEHYYKIISTYYQINNLEKPKIIIKKTNSRKIYNTILKKTNFKKIPKADIVILGIIHHLVSKDELIGNGDFKWVLQTINNKKVLYLGCEFSIWGDISGKLSELLIKYKKAKEIIYIGKLGTLNRNIVPNISLATGNESYINNKVIKWNNIFDDLKYSKKIYFGRHYTLSSVLSETKQWFNETNKNYDFVDPEIGHIAYSCIKNNANFSYLHVVSDNLNRNSEEDLSNERDIDILKKRNKLYNDIKQILIDKQLLKEQKMEPLEIEVKLKINNIEKILNILNNVIKADFIKEKKQKDTYYNHSKNNLLKNKITYLRVREESNAMSIAMHYRKDNKDWVELETKVEKPEIIKQIFENVGFTTDIIVNKTRKTYKKENTEFVIDYIEGLGYFLEIESDTKNNLNKYIKIFEFDTKEIEEFDNISYADMMRNHQKLTK